MHATSSSIMPDAPPTLTWQHWSLARARREDSDFISDFMHGCCWGFFQLYTSDYPCSVSSMSHLIACTDIQSCLQHCHIQMCWLHFTTLVLLANHPLSILTNASPSPSLSPCYIWFWLLVTQRSSRSQLSTCGIWEGSRVKLFRYNIIKIFSTKWSGGFS